MQLTARHTRKRSLPPSPWSSFSSTSWPPSCLPLNSYCSAPLSSPLPFPIFPSRIHVNPVPHACDASPSDLDAGVVPPLTCLLQEEEKDGPQKPDKKDKKAAKKPDAEPVVAAAPPAPVEDPAPVPAPAPLPPCPPPAAEPVEVGMRLPPADEMESIVGLFKSLAVISHSYLYLRLCFALEHDGLPAIGPADLKEVAQLAQLVLEMPIPDSQIILRQERSGQQHLALLLADSNERPAVLSPEDNSFLPMSHTYAQLRQVPPGPSLHAWHLPVTVMVCSADPRSSRESRGQ